MWKQFPGQLYNLLSIFLEPEYFCKTLYVNIYSITTTDDDNIDDGDDKNNDEGNDRNNFRNNDDGDVNNGGGDNDVATDDEDNDDVNNDEQTVKEVLLYPIAQSRTYLYLNIRTTMTNTSQTAEANKSS